MAKHTPPGDTGFSWSLARHVAAALALVLVVAAGFWGIGRMQDDPAATIASGPETTSTPDVTATGEATTPAGEATTPATEPTTAPPTPAPTVTATAAPSPTDEPTGTEDAATEDDEDVRTGGGEIDPAEISVQVLDATGGDADAAADVADQLRDDGFNVVATNKAVRRYDVTTVFYTPGNEAKAEQLAAMYGYREVAPEPGNLSHSVDVHVVVGADA